MGTTIYPIGQRVLIQIAEEASKIGSIYIPDDSKEKKAQGKVIAVSEDVDHVAVGYTVIFGKYAGDEVVVDGTEMRLVKEEDILAILEEDEASL